MNIGFDLFIAFAMAIVTFIVTKSIGEEAGQAIVFLGSFAVIFPLAIILLTGIFEMQKAGTNISAVNAVENNTITNITDWFTSNLPGAVISDLGGFLAGAVIGLLTGNN